MSAVTSVDALFARLEASAAQNDEEDVTLLVHALECAHLLHGSHRADPELVVAGLVHDLGWTVDRHDEAGHAANGAALVRPLLGDRVARLVAGHVDAKRYLVARDAAYRDELSPRSRATLVAQGDVMTDAEARTFERDAEFDALVALRRADDGAKVPDAPVPSLEFWRPLVESIARQR
jgi:predicted HD phosphohydrolase